MSDLLLVKRTKTTSDAFFGEIYFNGAFVGYSMERIGVAIPAGTYGATLAYSGHFKRLTPHIAVPDRTYIEIHPANWPSQLEGCIAIGSAIDGDALDNSGVAFEKLMKLITGDFTVTVE